MTLLFRATCEIAAADAKLALVQKLLRSPQSQFACLYEAAKPTQEAAKTNAPYHSGKLAGNIRSVEIGPGMLAVRTDLPYSWMRERGGTIVPKRASLLHWFDYGGGEHFASSVTQTGTHYMQRAYEETRLAIPVIYLRTLLAQIEAL